MSLMGGPAFRYRLYRAANRGPTGDALMARTLHCRPNKQPEASGKNMPTDRERPAFAALGGTAAIHPVEPTGQSLAQRLFSRPGFCTVRAPIAPTPGWSGLICTDCRRGPIWPWLTKPSSSNDRTRRRIDCTNPRASRSIHVLCLLVPATSGAPARRPTTYARTCLCRHRIGHGLPRWPACLRYCRRCHSPMHGQRSSRGAGLPEHAPLSAPVRFLPKQ